MSNPTTVFPFVKIIITILVAWQCSAQAEKTQWVEEDERKYREGEGGRTTVALDYQQQ